MGIDEAGAVQGDAVGVGDDDIGTLSGHFNIPSEAGSSGAGDFVQDDAGAGMGATPLQVGVARHHAAQLGVADGAGVVQDHAVGVDVELGVVVVT